MALDKKTQVTASVILSKSTYAEVREIAKENKRSASAQMAYMIEESIKEYNKKNDRE